VIIVDTSIWVDQLRGIDTPLDDILGSGLEMLHPFVHGELLLSGLPKRGAFAEQLLRIKRAPLGSPADVAAFIMWAELAGTGIGYVDTHLLVSARLLADGKILTKDKSLADQARRFDVIYEP
jgi:predicted nucleic acid-binding protein